MASEAGRAAHAARVIEGPLEAINQPPGYRVRRPAGPAPDAPTAPPGGEVAVCGRVGDGNTLTAEGSERRPCAQCPEEVWVSPATLALKPERFLCTACAVTAAGAPPISASGEGAPPTADQAAGEGAAADPAYRAVTQAETAELAALPDPQARADRAFIVQPPLLPHDPGPADLPPAAPFDLTIFALRQELSTALGLKVGRIPGLLGYTRGIADRVLDRLQHNRPYENFAGLADGLGERSRWQGTFLVLRALVLTGEVVIRHYGPCLWYLRPDHEHKVPWYLRPEHYPAAADDPEQGDPFNLALDAVGGDLGCAIMLGVPRFVGPPAQHLARQALALLTPSQEYTLVALMEALQSSPLATYLVLQALVIRGDLRVVQRGSALVYGRGARSTEVS